MQPPGWEHAPERREEHRQTPAEPPVAPVLLDVGRDVRGIHSLHASRGGRGSPSRGEESPEAGEPLADALQRRGIRKAQVSLGIGTEGRLMEVRALTNGTLIWAATSQRRNGTKNAMAAGGA